MEFLLEPGKTGQGKWYWGVKLEEGIYAEGFVDTLDEAADMLTEKALQWQKENPWVPLYKG